MKHFTAISLALLAASSFAQAEDTRFGFQATVSKPAGDVGEKDWMDSKLGYGIGLHLLVDLGGGGAIVPRIDYTMYKNDRTIGSFITEDARLKILSGGADFHYYFSGEASQGFYIMGGLGYASGKFENEYASPVIILNSDGSKGAFYIQAGLGLQFTRNFGVEVRYQSLDFKDVDTTFLGLTSRQDVSCPSLQASFVMRF